jgi:hypothetical protein
VTCGNAGCYPGPVVAVRELAVRWRTGRLSPFTGRAARRLTASWRRRQDVPSVTVQAACGQPAVAGTASSGPPTVVVSADYTYLGNPVLVIKDLADLQGPSEGVVILPVELFYSDPRGSVFDLASPSRRAALCRTVLRQAKNANQLADWVNAAVLEESWPKVARLLPEQVRAAWLAVHPQLGATTALPAAS